MPKLLDRLVNKLTKQGVKEPYGLATEILMKNGYMKKDGTLTEKGKIKEKLPEWTHGLWEKKDIWKTIRAWLWKR